MFILIIGAIVVFTVVAASFISFFIGVPFLPTKRKQAKKMIELASITTGTKVVDLGSGAGRLLFLAAAQGAIATGYELNPLLVWWTRLVARLRAVRTVEVKQQNLYTADLKEIDVVFAFLFPEPMEKLSGKLFTELKPGATIISCTFSIPDKKPVYQSGGIFVYQV